MPVRDDIYIRDPFVVPNYKEKKYYLFGTTDRNCWNEEKATGFDYYISDDLEKFDGPFEAFRPGKEFWADRNFWAAEVHQYNDEYYMFASFITDGKNRGTQILHSKEISGPYKPHSHGALTPENWMCLDGTLYVDEEGQAWMVFCHEWVEVYDGEICAVKLSKDLKKTIGDPVVLFKASDAPWSKSIRIVDGKECYVTDGPFFYTTSDNNLIMIWSSFVENNRYALGIAHSETANVLGPWKQEELPLISNDAGHGMIFKTFDGNLKLSIHTPNKKGKERPVFIDIKEENNSLVLG